MEIKVLYRNGLYYLRKNHRLKYFVFTAQKKAYTIKLLNLKIEDYYYLCHNKYKLINII